VFIDKKISRHHDGRFLFSRFCAQLRAQLNAYYARLYGLTRDELRYILALDVLPIREGEPIRKSWRHFEIIK
jgi:hypothetical protein